eukprot:gene8396-924_t
MSSLEPSPKTLCKYFLHGACSKGSRCLFSHDLTDSPDNVCRYYLAGHCNYGRNCRYDHVRPKKKQQQSTSTKSAPARLPNRPQQERQCNQCPSNAESKLPCDKDMGSLVESKVDIAVSSFADGNFCDSNAMNSTSANFTTQFLSLSLENKADQENISTPILPIINCDAAPYIPSQYISTEIVSSEGYWNGGEMNISSQHDSCAFVYPTSSSVEKRTQTTNELMSHQNAEVSEALSKPRDKSSKEDRMLFNWREVQLSDTTIRDSNGNIISKSKPVRFCTSMSPSKASTPRKQRNDANSTSSIDEASSQSRVGDMPALARDSTSPNALMPCSEGNNNSSAQPFRNNEASASDFGQWVPDSSSQMYYPQPFGNYADVARITALNSGDLASTPLCPTGKIYGQCFAANCLYLHGIECPICHLLVLHPYRVDDNEQHINMCLQAKQSEEQRRKMIGLSKDIECGICMDIVLAKEAHSERRFGILPNCKHAFCLGCIRQWRYSSSGRNSPARTCPLCRVVSHFVIPCSYFVSDDVSKQEVIKAYKDKLQQIDCKHFDFGKGNCPFGDACFYRHVTKDGKPHVSGKPRYVYSDTGEVRRIESNRLSSYLTLREQNAHD